MQSSSALHLCQLGIHGCTHDWHRNVEERETGIHILLAILKLLQIIHRLEEKETKNPQFQESKLSESVRKVQSLFKAHKPANWGYYHKLAQFLVICPYMLMVLVMSYCLKTVDGSTKENYTQESTATFLSGTQNLRASLLNKPGHINTPSSPLLPRGNLMLAASLKC